MWDPLECRTYSRLIFMEHLVVATQSNAEDDGRHVFEAVDPFLPLWPLTSHIKQPGGGAQNQSLHSLNPWN